MTNTLFESDFGRRKFFVAEKVVVRNWWACEQQWRIKCVIEVVLQAMSRFDNVISSLVAVPNNVLLSFTVLTWNEFSYF